MEAQQSEQCMAQGVIGCHLRLTTITSSQWTTTPYTKTGFVVPSQLRASAWPAQSAEVGIFLVTPRAAGALRAHVRWSRPTTTPSVVPSCPKSAHPLCPNPLASQPWFWRSRRQPRQPFCQGSTCTIRHPRLSGCGTAYIPLFALAKAGARR